MAHYSVNISEVQRSKGGNVVSAAAYNARAKLTLYVLDPDTGITSTMVFDYSKKPGLVYSKITICVEACVAGLCFETLLLHILLSLYFLFAIHYTFINF